MRRTKITEANRREFEDLGVDQLKSRVKNSVSCARRELGFMKTIRPGFQPGRHKKPVVGRSDLSRSVAGINRCFV